MYQDASNHFHPFVFIIKERTKDAIVVPCCRVLFSKLEKEEGAKYLLALTGVEIAPSRREVIHEVVCRMFNLPGCPGKPGGPLSPGSPGSPREPGGPGGPREPGEPLRPLIPGGPARPLSPLSPLKPGKPEKKSFNSCT